MENMSALLTLSLMEIILGIDNIIFIAILTGRLPSHQRPAGRNIGLGLALLTRLLLLFCISWIMGLTEPLFTLFNHSLSGRDLILLIGGLFLLGKATYEIHHKMEEAVNHQDDATVRVAPSFMAIVTQIMLLDIVFSLDSVITAVGMAKSLTIMVTAVVISMIVMMASAGTISRFVEKHPSIKILALSFLILIGVVLIVEGMGGHVGKGYIYFAMFFSLMVELINMRAGTRKRS